jgi:integrase
MPTRKRNFGSIRKLPSGRHQARYTAPDGTIVNAPRTYASIREADSWLAQQQADLSRGTWQDPNAGAITLSEYATSWLASRSALAPRTRDLYQRLLDQWIGQPGASPESARGALGIGGHSLRHLSPATVAAWYGAVAETSRERVERRLSAPAEGDHRWNAALRRWSRENGMAVAGTGRIPAAARDAWRSAGQPGLVAPRATRLAAGRTQAAQAYRLLHAVLQTAVDDGLIASNPCRLAGAGRTQAPERRPASVHEIGQLYAAAPTRYRAAILIAAWGGLRAGEIFALTRADVDLGAGAITVERTLSYLPSEGFHFGPPKTAAGYRRVHLPAEVVAAISAHVAAMQEARPDALLFTTESGSPVHSGTRTVMFRRAAASIGRDDLRFHDLRHTGATLAAQSGASLKDIMRRIGHSSVRAALIYQHASEDADRRIAARLGAMARPDEPVFTRLNHHSAT